MSRRAAVIATVAALAGCGGDSGGGGGGGANFGTGLEIELKEQNASAITGYTTLSAEGDKTSVVTEMVQPFDIDPQPIHIHKSTCANASGESEFELSILEDGVGGDTIDVSLDDLLAGGYVIEVHKSRKDEQAVACGEIKAPPQ